LRRNLNSLTKCFLRNIEMKNDRSTITTNDRKVSVISIALSPEEFAPLKESLTRQTFQDFEFVGEVRGTIPEAWNRAIARAKGEILIFTETDALPVNERWLEELVNSVPDNKTIVKGLEITSTPWDLSNLACHRSAFDGDVFDTAFRWAEDTELFCRLKARDYKFVELDKAPVIHLQKLGKKRMLRRAFRYGLYWARLRHRYADPVEVMDFSTASKVFAGALLNLLGLLIGYLIYWPERRLRKRYVRPTGD
jgi:hypothetical protein